MFINSIQHSEKGEKEYPQHDPRVISLVTILNIMIIEVMSRFIVYELVNISLCVDCDNLLAPKKD